MRKTLLIAAALGGTLILPACADTGYGYYGASVAAVGPGDVYYDNFYGPYTDGYWGPDDFFYYRGGDGRFIRDENRHFRHEMFEGAHRFQSRPFDRDRDGDRR